MTAAARTRNPSRTRVRSRTRTRSRTFPGRRTGVSDARHWLECLLSRASDPPVPESTASTAALLLSEAATNAVRHTASGSRPGGTFTVRVHIGGDALTVDVEDEGAATVPTLGTPGGDDESGRGLLLIDAFADTWGVRPEGCGLSFTLARCPSPAPAIPPVPQAVMRP
ncbi:ATP-binding protein [Streptomonospora sp. PA3]|uniref:ATP-binding protein n=1 Tax=Streptomonospora sp. PA3 TaxID=2607326 RepID=UPI0012DF272E|nr:ATP-binding protein [Streptomonospora sp. PA3]MUL42049.1 ATP-binding protein [Streptomonospora sp. PA3]